MNKGEVVLYRSKPAPLVVAETGVGVFLNG